MGASVYLHMHVCVAFGLQLVYVLYVHTTCEIKFLGPMS